MATGKTKILSKQHTTLHILQYSKWRYKNQKQFSNFAEGNFVVKRSSHRFNEVPVDQATEWQNRMCKLSSGIIGITCNDTAQDHILIFKNKLKSYMGYKILIMKQYQLAKKGFHQE